MVMRIVTALLIGLFISGVSTAFCSGEAPLSLKLAAGKVEEEFGRLDVALKNAAATLGASGLEGETARSALRQLCGALPYAVDCSAIDGRGRMVTVEPAPFRRFEGTDISGQEQVRRVRESGKPVLSSVFRAVEGFEAADAEYPVVNPGGRFIGSVSVLFSPARLLGDIIHPLTQGAPLDIWAMEKGGRILYDADSHHTGLNLFSSRPFSRNSRFQRLGRNISSLPQGSGFYWSKHPSAKRAVKKTVFWRTVSLYGAQWRLIGMRAEHDASGKRIPRAGTAEPPEQALESLAAETSLIAALSLGEKKMAMEILKGFYDGVPAIYSVQWVDENGVNRFGYPPENSLSGYDYHKALADSDPETLRIVKERKPAAMEARLFEGRTGVFTFRPVFSGERYLGMLYYIRIKP